MKRLLLITTGLLLFSIINAHPWKPRHYVIIDTDGGIDDIKAICMLLASPDVKVLAITTSPGTLSAGNAYIKVKSLLNSLYHEGIPVGINSTGVYTSDNFRVALDYKWGEEKDIDPEKAPSFDGVIQDILKWESSKISFICLGGMSSVISAMKTIKEFNSQVKQILWSSGGLTDTKGFNYNIDKNASQLIIKQGIPVSSVAGNPDPDFFDTDLIKIIRDINTPYGKKIAQFLDSGIAREHMYSFKAYDEMVPLFLHFPDYFTVRTTGKNSEIAANNLPQLKEGFLKIIKGETVTRNQVIKLIPADPSFYFDDINPEVSGIIEQYGIDEWTSGVIANELHRHLGVFAIIGVKMGIRAREYFNTGVDEFSAISYAGSVPPLSCMNDGILVSTGATPGHGLLTVRNDTALLPMVDFTYLGRKIRIRLKPDIAEKISGELKEINFVYGLDSDIYWELVRKNSIKYWKDLDRHEIFEIKEL